MQTRLLILMHAITQIIIQIFRAVMAQIWSQTPQQTQIKISQILAQILMATQTKAQTAHFSQKCAQMSF